MATKEYQKIWRENHKEKCYEYRKRYEKKNPEYFKAKQKRRSQTKKFKIYYNKYMRNYSKREHERRKKVIRLQSQRVYGKVPKGYERHHINYDSPHNFILIPIKEHKKIHIHKNENKKRREI